MLNQRYIYPSCWHRDPRSRRGALGAGVGWGKLERSGRVSSPALAEAAG